MFCNICGSPVDNGSGFCPKCGKTVVFAAGADAASYTLTLARENQFFAVNPAIKVKIDNGQEHLLDNGMKMDIPIAAGPHKISFSCNIRNKVVDVDVNGDFTLAVGWDRFTGSLKVSEVESLRVGDGSAAIAQQTPATVQKAPYDKACIVGLVVSCISLLVNFFGLVGIAGVITSTVGLVNCRQKKRNGMAPAIIGIATGAFSTVLFVFQVVNLLSDLSYYYYY